MINLSAVLYDLKFVLIIFFFCYFPKKNKKTKFPLNTSRQVNDDKTNINVLTYGVKGISNARYTFISTAGLEKNNYRKVSLSCVKSLSKT